MHSTWTELDKLAKPCVENVPNASGCNGQDLRVASKLPSS